MLLMHHESLAPLAVPVEQVEFPLRLENQHFQLWIASRGGAGGYLWWVMLVTHLPVPAELPLWVKLHLVMSLHHDCWAPQCEQEEFHLHLENQHFQLWIASRGGAGGYLWWVMLVTHLPVPAELPLWAKLHLGTLHPSAWMVLCFLDQTEQPSQYLVSSAQLWLLLDLEAWLHGPSQQHEEDFLAAPVEEEQLPRS